MHDELRRGDELQNLPAVTEADQQGSSRGRVALSDGRYARERQEPQNRHFVSPLILR
jgi:hypothetical protein